MKISSHIPTESYGFITVEFESYEEYIEKYKEIYSKVKKLQVEVQENLILQKGLDTKKNG